MIKNVAIFASGDGSNTQNIIDYFKSSTNIKVALVVSNKPGANVLNRAKNSGIPTLLIDKKSFYETTETINFLRSANIDLIVLAGFLWMIPESLIKAFPGKIVNIHPSLLPKFGGKGMYGMNVHKAVIEAKEKESGISIHYVNEKYDEGKIISQHKCEISENDSADILAEKIHQLEYENFPKTIEKLLS
ncbi:MAG: phosphoribosylglycinamide formyltransferase [Bacteroidia bacterium]